VIALAATLAAAPVAAEAASWGPVRWFPSDPVELEGFGASYSPSSIAMNARGDVIVGLTGSASILERDGRTLAWSGERSLGAAAGKDIAVDVAIDRGGDAVAAWVRGGRLLAATRRLGRWSEPAIVGERVAPGSARVTIGDDGTARAAWASTGGTSGGWVVGVAAHPLQAVRWGPVGAALDAGPAVEAPVVAIDAAGDVAAAWRAGAPGTVSASRRLAGHRSWEPPRRVSGPEEPGPFIRIAIGPRGDSAVTWPGLGATDEERLLGLGAGVNAVVRSRASTDWPPRQALGDQGERIARGVAVGVDAHGDAAAVWAGASTGHDAVRVGFRMTDGDWRAETVRQGTDDGVQGSVIVPRTGRPFVLWSDYLGGGRSLTGIVRPRADGPWQAEPFDAVVGGGLPPALAAARGDRAIALFADPGEGGSWSGLKVQDLGAPTIPRIPRATAVLIRRGGRALLEVRLARRAGVSAAVSRGLTGAGGPVRTFRARPYPAGTVRLPLGKLASGGYLARVRICAGAAGCEEIQPAARL
jgi:hypothetical protein